MRSSLMQRVLLRSALLVASVALVVLVAEGVARLTWRESKPPPPPPFALLRLPVLRTIAEIDRPGVRGVFKGHLFRTNSHGVRGPEYATRPPRGVFRIAIVGDSVTMGSGVDEEDAYPAQLEALLNLDATAGDQRYEVLNFGLAANNIERSVLRLRYLAGVYHPDLVVYGFTINDIEGRNYEPFESESESDRGGYRSRAGLFDDSPSYLLRALWPGWLGLLDRIWPAPHSRRVELFSNYFENGPAWGNFVLQLDRLGSLALSDGSCVNLLIHTHLSQLGWLHPYRPIYDRVAEAAEQSGLTVTRSLPYFGGHREIDLWVNRLDPHPNPVGHGILARALYDGLQALPAECWESIHGRRRDTRRPSAE